MASANFKQRVLFAVIYGLIALAVTAYGGLPWRLLVAALSLIVFYEWITMHGRSIRQSWTLILGAALVLLNVGIVANLSAEVLLTAAIGLSVVAGILAQFAALSRIAFGGFLYGAFPAIALADLRSDAERGLATIAFLFIVVWSTDIFAYVFGKAIGGPKLAPKISPGKTWSGAIFGTLTAVVVGFAVASLMKGTAAYAFILWSLLLSIVSQLGDLFESRAKRRCGVKDSGRIMPGHGGVLDRIDGLVAAAVLLYAIGVVQGGIGEPGEGLFPRLALHF